MQIAFYALASTFILLLIIFRTDVARSDISLLSDRFFWTILLFPFVMFIFLSWPLFNTLKFDFSSKGYATFIDKFTLPIGIIAISAPLTAIYGLLHTSREKNREIKQIRARYLIESIMEKKYKLNEFISSSDSILVSLKRLTSHIKVLGEILSGPMSGLQSQIDYELNLISTMWAEIYTEPQFKPASAECLKHFTELEFNITTLIHLGLIRMEAMKKHSNVDYLKTEEVKNSTKSIEECGIVLEKQIRIFRDQKHKEFLLLEEEQMRMEELLY